MISRIRKMLQRMIRVLMRPRMSSIRAANRADFLRLCEIRFKAPYAPNKGIFDNQDAQ